MAAVNDANNLKQTEDLELLQHSDRLLRASAAAVNTLFADADFSAGVARALKIIGEAADVDRVYIFESHVDSETGGLLASQSHEWARESITPQIANPALQNVEYLPVFKRWYEMFSAGRPICGLIRDFPEEERPLLESQDIIALLAAPIKIKDNLWGFIGFDDCRRARSWTPDEMSILATIATNIGHIIFQKQTEKILKRFQAALDGAGDAIGMADMQGRHFYQNKAFSELFGYNTAQELQETGGPRAVFDNPADHQAVFQSILSGGSWRGELKMHARNRRLLSVLLQADVIKDNEGRPIAVFGIHTDITRRKEIENALQESEIRYRRLVEAITDYIYTVNVENGQAVNTHHGQNCVAVTGYSSGEYEADPNLWFKMVHSDDRQMVLEQAQRVLKGETTQPVEHRIYHKNGYIRWVRNTPVPHFDASGKLISYDGLVSNVTERKNAEEQLKEHARKLEILNRIITAVNRVDNLGMLLNELLKSSMEMVSFDGGGIYLVNANNETAELICHQGLPDDFPKKAGVLKLSAANCRMLFIEGKPIITDDYSVTSEGDTKWNMQSVARIPLISKDKIIGALVLVNAAGHAFNENEKEILLSVGRQIGTAIAKMRSETALRESERKYRTINEHLLRREQELLKANHEKEILLKEIHHRVKNNLQVISSLINLQIHHIADHNAVALLKECQSRIKTIAIIHEKMYQLGDLTRVDIGSYLESLTGHIGRMYLADQSSATIKVDAKNIHLPIDQAIPCALIVNELVVNSLKHAFPKHQAGEISVQLTAGEGGHYVLTVGDNGAGLPDGTDCRNTDSLGIQLVTTFVNQLRGTMEFANKPGATFKISFARSQKES